MKDDVCIEDLPLATRTMNALRNAEINTVGEVRKHSWHALLRLPGFGRRSLVDIIECIGDWGGYTGKLKVPQSREELRAASLQALIAKRNAAYKLYERTDAEIRALIEARSVDADLHPLTNMAASIHTTYQALSDKIHEGLDAVEKAEMARS